MSKKTLREELKEETTMYDGHTVFIKRDNILKLIEKRVAEIDGWVEILETDIKAEEDVTGMYSANNIELKALKKCRRML